MRKGFGIAIITLMLGCLPVQMVTIDRVQAQSVQDRKAEGDRLFTQGNQLYQVSQYREALQAWEQSLQIYREIKNYNGEGVTLSNLGAIYASIGQYQKAIEYFQLSLSIREKIGDLKGEGASLNNLGSIYDSLGQPQKAIEYFQQSLAIFKKIRNLNGAGSTLGNLGNVYESLGQNKKAIEYFQQSLVIAKQIGNRSIEGKSLNNLGNVYRLLGEYQKAIDYHQQSLAIAKQIGDLMGEGTALGNLGVSYNLLGQNEKAINYYQQSLAIAKQIGDLKYQGTALSNLGNAYTTLKEYKNASNYFHQSLAIAKQIGDLNIEGISLSNLGVLYNLLGQYKKAIDHSQQALILFKQMGGRDGEGKSLLNLGDIFNNLNQPTLAIIFYKQSVNSNETIRKDISGLSKEEQKSYLSTVEKTYRLLADRLLKQDRVMEALQVLDLLKVQKLQDFLKDVKGNERTALGVQMLPQEQTLINQYNNIQNRTIQLGTELNDLRKLPNRTTTQQQRLTKIEQIAEQVNQQLTALLQSDSTKTLITQLQQTAAKQNLTLPSYKDLSERIQRIGQGTALFYPLILSDRIELVIFIPNQPLIHRSIAINQKELETEIKTFRNQLQNRDPNIEVTAQKLYKYLLEPIDADLKAAKIQTIVYAPDGQLRYVPLAALHDGKQWIVERYLINNVTAVSLTNLDPSSDRDSRVLAGAFEKGNFSFNINDKAFSFSGLPFAGKEVDTLANTIPNTTKLLDKEFSRAAILPNLKTNNIIHLANHAAFVEGTPEDSFILMGNGDRINLREIDQWDLPNVSLIVLSACQTAVGGNLGNGIEILGFGYQLQRAKVRSAIASLWTVSDGGTQKLMEAFYTALKKGKVSHAEALRQAQVALITGNYEALGELRGQQVAIEPRIRQTPAAPTKISHPYYWDPFILIGSGL